VAIDLRHRHREIESAAHMRPLFAAAMASRALV
jgi:hypothetical protein